MAMLWKVVSYLTLVGEVVMLVLAIRLSLVRRTRTFALLMWACVCFVIARSSWFTFGFVGDFLSSRSDEAARAAVDRWHEYTNFTFQLLFVLLMISTLISFIRERSSVAIPSV
ncbi:MAG TPA: hypothetical protein VNX27_08855 [Chthoniobacterales bacterium]|jgi:hypothetical protein|nr:hypothetical protein [Chthoniobacterales bacterium]